METRHEINWQVEGSDMVYSIPAGAEVTFWIDRGVGPNEERKVTIRYTSEPYSEDNPALEILMPNGKNAVINLFECTISQE